MSVPKRKLSPLVRMLPGVRALEEDRDGFVEIALTQTRIMDAQQGKINGLERENGLAKRLLKSKIPAYILEHCAEELVREIVEEVIKAMEVVKDERQSEGGPIYSVGIRIPELHIRKQLPVEEAALCPVGDAEVSKQKIRHLDLRMFDKTDD